MEQAATERTGACGVAAFARLKRNRADIGSAVRWALEAGHLRVAGAITGSLQLCTHSTPELELDELVMPQLWTTIRIVAEFLVARGHDQDAMFLLAAADAAESAPPVTGDDVRRYQQLSSDLRERLGAELAAQIAALARGVPRAQVLHRTMTLLGKQAH